MAPTPGPAGVTTAIVVSLLSGFYFANPGHRQVVKEDLTKVEVELQDIAHKVTTKVVGDKAHVVTRIDQGPKSLVNGIVDKGGKLSSAIKSSITGFKHFIHCTFSSLDTNGDGKVHISELRKKLDDNGDGVITVNEWMDDTCEYTIAVDASALQGEGSGIFSVLKWWVLVILADAVVMLGIATWAWRKRRIFTASGTLSVTNIKVDNLLLDDGAFALVKVGRHKFQTNKDPRTDAEGIMFWEHNWTYEPFAFEVDYRLPKELTELSIAILEETDAGSRAHVTHHVTIDTVEFAKAPHEVFSKNILLKEGGEVLFDIVFKPDAVSDEPAGSGEPAKASF